MTTLIDTVRKFVKSAAIKRKIAFFYEHHGNGFEKWLQFEMMHWLQENQGHKVYLEAGIAADQRKTSKTKFQVDVLVKMKNQANDIFHAVELKVTKGKATAMRKAVLDLIRLSKSKGSEWDFRSVTAMVVCEGGGGNKYKYEEYLKALKAGKKQAWVFERHAIKKGGASIYLLYWRAPPRMAEKENFSEFVQYLTTTAREVGISEFENKKKKL